MTNEQHLTQLPESTDLRFTINTTDTEGNPMQIKIRLNDECKNGHQDFSITATGWEKGKPKTDRNMIYGGCCHEEILKVEPTLRIFVNLHLCDYKGIPMHAVANGFYFLREGFESAKPGDENFKEKYCEYYRIYEWQFDRLMDAENEIQYALLLQQLHILDQWELEAQHAIKQLEDWTEYKFKINSVKTQYVAPTPEQIADENQKQTSGYYTQESKVSRRIEAENKLMADLLAKEESEIAEIKTEYSIKAQVLQIGGQKALENCIYYNHTKQLAFNWKGYDNISDDIINNVIDNIKLPEGASIANKRK